MNKQKLPYNYTNTTILRVDIPFTDFTHITGSELHDCAFVLEDMNGAIAAVELFSLQQFCDWYCQGISGTSEEIYQHIFDTAQPSKEEGIELFIEGELLQEFEQFRCSQYNKDSHIKPL